MEVEKCDLKLIREYETGIILHENWMHVRMILKLAGGYGGRRAVNWITLYSETREKAAALSSNYWMVTCHHVRYCCNASDAM